MKKLITLSLSLFILPTFLQAQIKLNPVLTAVPSLHITPDARAAALGEQGVASSADIYSQYWNPAKYPFISSRSGFGFSYTPWLSKITNDIALMQFVGYHKLDKQSNHTLGASIRYFSLGKVTTWDEIGRSLGTVSPSEFAIDVSYAIKLGDAYALSATLRYINSKREFNAENKSASAVVADFSAYMNRYIRIGEAESRWTAGISLRNMGAKLSLDDGQSHFLPTNLSIGTGLLYPIDPSNALSLQLEVNKLLVPAYPRFGDDSAKTAYEKTSAMSGMLKSFSDAPGGFSEELKELRWSIGAEYNHKDKFFARLGYSYLHPDKGNLQALTAGAGFKLSAFRIDAAYTISTVAYNPLDQTLRFSLGFDLEALTKLFK